MCRDATSGGGGVGCDTPPPQCLKIAVLSGKFFCFNEILSGKFWAINFFNKHRMSHNGYSGKVLTVVNVFGLNKVASALFYSQVANVANNKCVRSERRPECRGTLYDSPGYLSIGLQVQVDLSRSV